MINFFRKFSKIFLLLFSCYSIFWYCWGIYIKTNLGEIISTSLHKSYIVKYDSVELSGYPFAYHYKVKNLNLSPNNIFNFYHKFLFREIDLFADLTFKDLQVDMNRNLHINLNNKNYYCVKWDEGLAIRAKLERSYLEQIFTKQDNRLHYFTYFDSGYNILDKNLNQIIFISRNNWIKFIKNNASRQNEYEVSMNLDGEGGDNAPNYIRGEYHFTLDMVYKFYEEVRNVDMFFNKVKFSTDKYNINISGAFNHSNSLDNRDSKVNIEINNFSSFTKFLDIILYKKYSSSLKEIILYIAENKYNAQEDIIIFSVASKGNKVKYGTMETTDIFTLLADTQKLIPLFSYFFTKSNSNEGR